MAIDSAAWDNAGFGFTEWDNLGAVQLTNNTAYRHRVAGFALLHLPSVLKRNLALANAQDTWLGSLVVDADNSWNRPGWSTSVLRSTDPASALAPRAPDGALPLATFLQNRKDRAVGAPMAP